MIVRLAPALVVFWVAYDEGSYGVTSRQMLAVAVWWAVLVMVLGCRRMPRLAAGAAVPVALFAAFAAFTGVSIAWSASAERAVAELDRALLYLGVAALAWLLASVVGRQRIAEGVALAIVGVAVLALASRLFPGLGLGNEELRFLPGAETRLSYPVGYWNGLAALLALGVPLLLVVAAAPRPMLLRAAAVTPLPAVAAAIYLTSSRGGAAVAVVGTALVVVLCRSWGAVGAAAAGAAGSVAAVAVVATRSALVDGPLRSSAAVSQGRSATPLLLCACAAAGLVFWAGCRLVPAPTRRLALGGAVPVAAGIVAATLVLAHPVRAFDRFKEPPPAAGSTGAGTISSHLLSSGGSGRWQFWSAAVEEFESRPVGGRGAGSFEAWWARHGSLAYFVRDAHSLYVETLGELGLVGLVLVVGAIGAGLASAVIAAARAGPHMRPAAAGVASTFAAYALAAGIDWMWELTVVSVVGLACLGLALAAPAGGPPRVAVRAALACACLIVALAEAVPLLAQSRLEASRGEARGGNLGGALAAAADAQALEPWAAAPYLQLGLVDELSGDLTSARRRLRQAIARDPEDWRLWLVAARLATKAGAISDARSELHQARMLNPRSPLFPRARS